MPRKSKKTEEIADFDPEEEIPEDFESETQSGSVAIHTSGFRDFLLKSELIRAIVDCSFENPSRVQAECLPSALSGSDLICQARSGMGKTAVFVLAVLHQINPKDDDVQALILCHTRELAFQITSEFKRFSTYLRVNTLGFFGGVPKVQNIDQLNQKKPQVVVGTPGRILDLVETKDLKLSKIKHFILDECDNMLDNLKMRDQIQRILKSTPRNKQIMMYSATMSKDTRAIAKKLMHEPLEILVDDCSHLTLDGLTQYYMNKNEQEKNLALNELLKGLHYNQVVIFVSTKDRAKKLNNLLNDGSYESICIYAGLPQSDRLQRFDAFKKFEKRILVATDLVGRGIDIQKVNVVINYDLPYSENQYLHRVGRAGRYSTKGLAVSLVNYDEKREDLVKNTKGKFVRESTDSEMLEKIQSFFKIKMEELKSVDDVDHSCYANN